MKKLLVFLVSFFLLGGIAMGQSWHIANQATLGWDAVTLKSDGTPLPETDVIEYVGYLSNALTDPDKTNPVEVFRTTNLESTVTLGVEGRFYFGVKAVRIVDGSPVGESTIAWSDVPENVKEGDTFGLQYFLPPAKPGGIFPK